MRILLIQKSGLGNQLFQYAAGTFFAERYGAQLQIVREPDALAVSHGYARPFLLSQFCITAPVRERGAVDKLMCSAKAKAALLSGTARKVTRTSLVREPFGRQWTFQPLLLVPPGTRNLYLEGYWQVYGFASAMEERLRQEFAFRYAATGKNLAMLEQIEGCAWPVSLHIRRGDYATAAEGNHVLPMTYYRNAIAAVRQQTDDPVFFVFSDDIAYARESLPPDGQYVFVDHNNDVSAQEDLRLMAACRDHVIANSTFSWWGAWLNPRQEKRVFAPDTWLDPMVPHPDLIPPEWIRIHSGR